MRYWSAFLIGVLGIPLPCAAARAEGASNSSQALVLFIEGRRLMTAGDYAAACPKLAESFALDPQADTALELSTCYERASQQALGIARAMAPPAEQSDRGDTPSESRESSESESPGRAQRVTGLVIGGVGVAGTVGGLIAEIVAISKRNELEASCRPALACDPAQVVSARTWAVAGDVSLLAGLAAVGAGAIVFFTAPKDPTVLRPSVGLVPTAHGAALSLRAAF